MKIGDYTIPKQRLYPTLVDGVKKIYDKFGGEDTELSLIADVLGHKVTSGGFFQKLADMRAYGVITGRGKVRVTDRGKKLTYPENEVEKMQALESIIRNIPLWDAIYSKFQLSPPDSNFWIDLRQITGVEAPEAKNKAESVRKAYMDDVKYLTPVEKPADAPTSAPQTGEAIGRSEIKVEAPQISTGAIGYIGFPEYSRAPIEIKDEVSYTIAKQLLDAIGQRLKKGKGEDVKSKESSDSD